MPTSANHRYSRRKPEARGRGLGVQMPAAQYQRVEWRKSFGVVDSCSQDRWWRYGHRSKQLESPSPRKPAMPLPLPRSPADIPSTLCPMPAERMVGGPRNGDRVEPG
ncbi:hypothetical protein C8Q77DRAFT_1132128 [Trametes polyzona]|nr:hypothetical protein C8Q77DRAFT_1132128 [Trametes polyzona]